MARVYLPPLLQPHAGGVSLLEVPGSTVRQVVEQLLAGYPALRPYLLDEHGNLRSHLAIAVDGEIASPGLRDELSGNPEIHFVMAIKGGR